METGAELVEAMADEISRPVAKVVRDLMVAAGLTQDRMAQRLGVSVAVVNQILAGKANPSYVTLTKLVDAFGVDPRLLFRDRLNGQESKDQG